jgi:hypothetical protein
MPAFGEVRAAAVSEGSPRAVFAGMSQSGVWRTKDDGLTWTPVNTGMEADPAYQFSVRTMAVDPRDAKHLLASFERTAYTPQYLYATSNTGDSWSRITNAPEKFWLPGFISCKRLGSGASGHVGRRRLAQHGSWKEFQQGRCASHNTSNINAITEEKNGAVIRGPGSHVQHPGWCVV